ncbi:MAG: AAA family ATPase, partial [Pseudomonadales bacterium]
MYEQHFHFRQLPFSIAPDPSFLYLSSAHREALAHLMYGFSHGGFVMVTGEVGTGKTTLLRNLIKQTPPELDVAFILNPRLTVRELLA